MPNYRKSSRGILSEGGNVAHEKSVPFRQFKEKTGLPTLKELQELEDKGYADQVLERIERLKKYAVANEVVYNQFASTGYRVANVIQDSVTLRTQLWELEEKLRSEGKVPIEDKVYQTAWKMLQEQVQFIEKHKLDVSKFGAELAKRKDDTDDDELFKRVN